MLRLENLDTDLAPPAVAVESTRRALNDDAANSYLPFEGQAGLEQARQRRLAHHRQDRQTQPIQTPKMLANATRIPIAKSDTGQPRVGAVWPRELGGLAREESVNVSPPR
jgi:hypothetical protein